MKIENANFSIRKTVVVKNVILIPKKVEKKANRRNRIRRQIRGLIIHLNYKHGSKFSYFIRLKSTNALQKLLELIKASYKNV